MEKNIEKNMEKIEYYIDNYRKTNDPQYLSKIQKSYEEDEFYSGFPSIHNKNFKQNLYNKKEFEKYDNTDTSRPSASARTFGPPSVGSASNFFQLAQHQLFAVKLINPLTPYNCLLLYYGTGSGKTCTALTISEQFPNKRTIIIHPKALYETWLTEIYNPKKHDTEQCLGGLYKKPDEGNRNKEAIQSKYTFYTPDKLGNIYQKHVDEETLDDWLLKTFENTIIIVDEVHHAREINNMNEKKLFELLGLVADKIPGIKMLFLSATPIYDNVKEINTIKDIFTRVDKIYEDVSLEWFSSRYVSYMSSYDIEKFPLRLTPSQVIKSRNILHEKNAPSLTTKGEKIEHKNRLRFIELISTPPSKNQEQLLSKTEAQKNTRSTETEGKGLIDQVSNIIFPDNKAGSDGLKSVVKRVNDNPIQFQYVQNIFTPTEFPKYAPKLAHILDTIQKAKGVVFVYSQYKDSGIYPLAMALEEIGFNNISGTNIVKKNTRAKSGIQNRQQLYMMIHGEETESIGPMLSKIEDNKNIHGETVKVILGTQVTGEGITLKHVREIHIVEPWWNLNRIEQITGRAIRNNSHEYLPLEERNVTVFYHTLQNPNSQYESYETQKYRYSLLKQIEISKYERIMKENAIDCGLQSAINSNHMYQKRHIITSRDTHITNYSLHNTDYSPECDFMKCGIKCDVYPPKQKSDLSTYYPTQMHHEKEIMKQKIQEKVRNGNLVLPFPEKTEEADIEQLAYVDMVENKELFKGPNDVYGYLVVINKGYVFQPEKIEDPKLTLQGRHHAIDSEPEKRNSMALHKTFSLSMRTIVETKEEKERYLDQKYKNIIENYNNIINTICEISYMKKENIDTQAVNCMAVEQIQDIHTLLYYDKDMPQWIIDALQKSKRGIKTSQGNIVIGNIYTTKNENTVRFNILTYKNGEITQADPKDEKEYMDYLTNTDKKPENVFAVFNPLAKEDDRFKLTVSSARSSAYRSIGRVCRTWNFDEIYSYMKDIFGQNINVRETLDSKNSKKSSICMYFYYLFVAFKPDYLLFGNQLMLYAYREENNES